MQIKTFTRAPLKFPYARFLISDKIDPLLRYHGAAVVGIGITGDRGTHCYCMDWLSFFKVTKATGTTYRVTKVQQATFVLSQKHFYSQKTKQLYEQYKAKTNRRSSIKGKVNKDSGSK